MELHVFFFWSQMQWFSNLAAVGDQTWFCADSFKHAAASSTQNKSASPVLAALSEVTLMDPTAFLPSAASSSVSLCLPGGRDVRTVTSIWLICSLWLTVANWLMFKIGCYNFLHWVRNITHDLFKCGNSLSDLCVGHYVLFPLTGIYTNSIYTYLPCIRHTQTFLEPFSN